MYWKDISDLFFKKWVILMFSFLCLHQNHINIIDKKHQLSFKKVQGILFWNFEWVTGLKCIYFNRFVQMNTPGGEEIRDRLQVPSDMDSLLLFNENTERPVASVSMSDIPVQTLQDIINSNKYLLLPRLSSQVCDYLSYHCLQISFTHVYVCR